MAKHFGLRGKSLRAALIWAVILPSYILYDSFRDQQKGGIEC